jgi:sugar phosphate isomerase/epimerase
MRLGGPVFEKVDSPAAWAAAVKKLGYSAAYCPVGPEADDATVAAYAKAAADADITIAEVGAWSSPMSADAKVAAEALDKCIRSLQLADRIGASCCVNIAGSRSGDKWAGPCELDYADDTLDAIVQVTRKIIDAVKPRRTFYTIEAMQWMLPDSAQSYLDMIKAVDRKGFAVHFDPVNMVISPRVFFRNGEFLRECFRLLGPHIKSCHAKDVNLSTQYLVHIDECAPGLGKLDYATFLREAAKLPADMPVMLEHLSKAEEFEAAATYLRQVAAKEGLKWR